MQLKGKRNAVSLLHKVDHYDIIIKIFLRWLGRTPAYMVPINPLLLTASIWKCFEITSYEHSWGLSEESIKRAFNNHPPLPTKQDIFEQLIKFRFLEGFEAKKQFVEDLLYNWTEGPGYQKRTESEMSDLGSPSNWLLK